ncbi:AraC family transcriptional regulator [Flavobacterium sp. 7A]|uniref:AraC family transcriptional regulator n=1 Tax=Flavobacterium sp. 7A TaxID=2940571 RepID=UPI0022260308|nr:helix-turn-helix transcriptional regulator [Flavobacterium sp. 7A]MCW2118072.1 YesN/AraC family two-component response regulator [Flavobacterium sp. 7A]
MKNIPNISFQSVEKSKDFEFLNLSDLFARMPDILDHNPTQPHRISFFALLLVTKGFGTHQIDLKEYDLKVGTVLKIAKGQVHAFQKNAKYEGYLIIFTEDFVVSHFSKSSINMISHLYNYHISSPIFSNEAGNRIFLDQLIVEVKNENKYAKENIVAALLNLYLLRLEREFNNTLENNNSNHYAIFIQFKNLVEAHYTSTRNVKDYANKLFISTKHLNQVVKEFTLNTAKHFIDDFVILETKRAMVSSNTSLKEIAYAVGFDEVTNFTKFFKKHTGSTPKQFSGEL